jgi:hypothetical protein
MAAWARERGPQSPTAFPAQIEVEMNLPPAWKDSLRGRS